MSVKDPLCHLDVREELYLEEEGDVQCGFVDAEGLCVRGAST